MGLHQGAPKFVPPVWYGNTPSEARRKQAVARAAERATAAKVIEKCEAALDVLWADFTTESPLKALFVAHRYVEQAVGMTDMHLSGRVHALGWDARGVRVAIESGSSIRTVENLLHALITAAQEILASDE